VTDVQVTGNIWWRESDAESSLGQWLAIGLVSWFEEAFSVPPVIVRRLNLDWVVARSW
jgi:hypothetical protein